MADLTEFQKKDIQKFFIEKGDVGFSPERNKQVIERSMKKYDARRNKEITTLRELYLERADAVVTYIKAIDRGGVDTRLDHFFTPNQIRYFNGEDIRAKIREGLTIVKAKHRLQK